MTKYRCFACENDDTADTALPVNADEWEGRATLPFDLSADFSGAYSYRCSFCDGINIKDKARGRHNKDWHRPSHLAAESGGDDEELLGDDDSADRAKLG